MDLAPRERAPAPPREAPVVALENVRAGVWMTVFCGGAVLLYVALTWSQPHRDALAILGLTAFAYAAAFASRPAARLLRGPLAGPLWLAWSVGLIAATAIGVAIDGGAQSPLVPVFAVPLMFSALCYPPRLAVPVAAADVGACAVALAATGSGVAYNQLVLSVLCGCAGMCIWHSRRQQRQHEQLDALSRTDALTGCLNRRGYEEQIGAFLADHRRYGRRFSLLLFDLDAFKAVNDERGHSAGDDLLRWTAEQLAGELRGGDRLARLGGDEFAVLLAETGPVEAAQALERFLTAVRARAAISGGLAACPDDGTDDEALYRVADSRMYVAKRQRPMRVGV